MKSEPTGRREKLEVNYSSKALVTCSYRKRVVGNGLKIAVGNNKFFFLPIVHGFSTQFMEHNSWK